MTTMTAGIDSNYRRSRKTLRSFGHVALMLLSILLPQTLLAQFNPLNPQQARTQSIIKPVYFASLELLQRGRYKQAIKGFQQAGRQHKPAGA